MEFDFRRVFSDLLAQLAKREWGLLGVQILLAVVIPAGISYAVNLVTEDDPRIRSIGTWILVLLILVQAILLVTTLLGPSTPARAIVALDELNNAHEELHRTYDILKDQRDSYYSSVFSANQSLGVIRGILDSADTAIDDVLLQDHLRRILEPYIVNRNLVFNFTEITAMYRLTVLLLDRQMDQLTQRYSYADPGIIQRKRPWTPKTGHAGRAFTEEKVIITPDLSEVDEYRDYYDDVDARQYRSMASIPLFNTTGVCGVLVITSSEPDQFDYENSVEIFETIGHIISLYLRYTGTKGVRPNG